MPVSASGGTVAIHAIGDRANDEVLDLFEGSLSDGADPGPPQDRTCLGPVPGRHRAHGCSGSHGFGATGFPRFGGRLAGKATGPTGRADLSARGSGCGRCLDDRWLRLSGRASEPVGMESPQLPARPDSDPELRWISSAGH